METRTISRAEAISTIYEAMLTDQIPKEYQEAFTEIADLLEHEIFGLDCWGVNGDCYGELVAAVDPESPEYGEHQKKVMEITSFWKLGKKPLCKEDEAYRNARISGFQREDEQ